MSRTDLDPACLVKALRRMAGDGGMEWCCEPIRASVLLDVADLLDENVKLRGLVWDMMRFFEDGDYCTVCEVERECTANEQYDDDCLMRDVFHDRMRELGVDDGVLRTE